MWFHRGRSSKLALVVGYLSLLGGVAAAHASPATSYELSIYAATPVTYWLGVGTALFVGVVVAIAAGGRVRAGGLALAGTAAITVVGLPVLRGYYYYGGGDSLSHLGWAREIATGALSPFDLLYPGIHTISILLASATGVPMPLAVLYVVLFVFVVLFVVFVPLCVDLLADTDRAVAVGLLAALLLLPINNVSVHPNAHPTSQAILFSAFVLFLALAYTRQAPRRAEGGTTITPLGVLLALASLAVLLVHPQQALNVLVFLVGVSVFQFFARWLWPIHPIASHRPLYGQTAFLLVAFLLWTPRYPRATGATTSVLGDILRTGAVTGEVVGSKSVSLTTIGGSIGELFVKLFLPSVVFSALAAVVMLGVVAGRMGRSRRRAPLAYLTVGLVPLFVAFGLFFISTSGDQYFRYLGFIMLPVTVLGAVALTSAVSLPERKGRVRIVAAVAVVFLLLVPMALVALHPSPYIYQPSAQVTLTDVSGYEASFEYREPGVEFTGIRSGPRRFVDAEYGTNNARFRLDFPGYEDGLDEDVFNEAAYDERYDDDRYLVVTRRNFAQEVELYQGFRYSEAGFRALETTPGIGRIRANDGFRLYLLDGESTEG